MTKEQPIRIAIADDHKIFRQGLKLALSDDVNLQLVAEAENGKDLLQHMSSKKVDVVLVDLKMPVMDGEQATREIKQLYPDIKVIVLTMHDDETFVLHLLEAGANSYLIKNADPEEIKTAIHSVHENGFYFNEYVSKVMLKKIAKKNGTSHKFNDNINLNDKEKQVLKLICEEHTTAEIGNVLFLSARTIEGIRMDLLDKVGVRNIAGLVVYAMRQGIIQ
jgi:DNA-binding NarL/FixJ family response regulator